MNIIPTLIFFNLLFKEDPYLITKEKLKQDESDNALLITLGVTVICIILIIIIIRWLFK